MNQKIRKSEFGIQFKLSKQTTEKYLVQFCNCWYGFGLSTKQ